jgi:deazaflavin-dependent oxidoreductase (nitroreductase family)
VAVDKRRVSTFLSARILNPVVRAASRAGVPLPGVVILETTGRRSGEPRRIPVGRAFVDDTLWVIAEHGRRAAYVRNIEAEPRVRVKVGRTWRTGTAQVLADDDWRERQRRIPNRLNSAAVRAMGSDPVTVRVDLDPAGAAATPAGGPPGPQAAPPPGAGPSG